MDSTKIILILLQEGKSLTSAQIAKESGLSVVSVNNIISKNLLSGKIITDNQNKADKGRPARLYKLNPNFNSCLNVALIAEKDQVRLIISKINPLGKVIYTKKQLFNNLDLIKLDDLINSILDEDKGISKVILCLPSHIKDGIIYSCDIKTLENFSINNRYKVDALAINDVNAAMYNESPSNDVRVGIYLPEHFSPGISILIGDFLYEGSNGLVGEYCFTSPGFSFEESTDINEKIKNIHYLLKSISFILNPDTVIIYSKLLKEDDIDNLRGSIDEKGIKNIIIKRDFETALINGLTQLSKKEII